MENWHSQFVTTFCTLLFIVLRLPQLHATLSMGYIIKKDTVSDNYDKKQVRSSSMRNQDKINGQSEIEI
jgi:hypothetical protein